MSLPDPAVVAELVRLPAVLSVPGDAWAGAAWSGSRRGAAMPLASAMLYLGGMALNDWADREIDRVERPERPIPSGRIDAETALAVGAGLLAGGVALAGVLGGRRGMVTASALAAAVWTYDTTTKDTGKGASTMAACRALDVLLGAPDGRTWAALPAAGLVGAHTMVVTELSRHEVHGAPPEVPQRAATATNLIGLAAAALAVVAPEATRWRRLLAAAAAAAYVARVGGPYQAAARTPEDAGAIRWAVGAGVMGVTALQSALLAGRGAVLRGAVTAAAVPLAGRLRERVT